MRRSFNFFAQIFQKLSLPAKALSRQAQIVALTMLVLVLSVAFVTWPSSSALTNGGVMMTLGSPITENFDTLATSGTANAWADNSTIVGWYSQFTATTTNPTTYRADAGGTNTGAIYSWGTGTATERALGSVASGGTGEIYNAVKLTNSTGSTITSLDINFVGEQWRQGGCTPTPCTPAAQKLDFQYQIVAAGTITDANTPTTGWTDYDTLDFTSPQPGTSTAAAIDGNAAANRIALSSTLMVSVPVGQEIWLRWKDSNDANNDHGLAVDDLSVTPQGAGGGMPSLSINDVTFAEGDPPGTTTFSFMVSLSSPAGAGGVTFDIATADGTAQDGTPIGEDNDYVANSLTGQTIPAGSSMYSFNVTVNRDTTTEANETFFVNVTNVTGATLGDGQGQGTINNDDVTLTRIHDIQGPGASSPIVGASVNTRGIVTGVKSNGFFLQEPDASVDANPATSEGIFVFTSSAPPAAAAVGNLVQVAGTVVEFVPSQDPQQPPLTELSSPTVTQITTGNPLPAAIPLTATFPDPTGVFDQLERVEGMRVSVASLTVGGPTLGNVNEPNATATSTGVFFGTVTGVPRAFREAGIQHPDVPPSGTIPPIPRWDTNPELIRVDSDGLVGGSQINVATAATVTGLIGPLDYGFRHYTILPDPASPPSVSGGMTATAVTTPTATEFTVASYNLERFFDDVNDPLIGEPVLTTTAYQGRLTKASLHIRDYLKTPDVVAIVEIENLSTLQALATKINNDAVANSQPNPLYTAYLVEGNDVGGIDVGFLVKTAIVTGSTPRVTVNSVVQELDASLFTNADSSTETLHDRPPLRLDATVNFASGATFPIQVIANHLRSLNGVDDNAAGSSGWATVGARVRAKRLAQVVDLATLIQTRQTNNPNERLITVGDFNFFEVNDGYGDSMSTLLGAPVPDNQTVVPGDGVDLVTPDLTLLLDSLLQRYSFVFDGNAQSLDHAIINSALIAATSARRLEHPRVNGDFPETDRNGLTTRLADHDPLVAYFQLVSADLAITKTDSPDPVTAGTDLAYTITATNNGPDAAANTSWSDTLPTGTTFVSLSAAGGWSCTTPAIGAGGTVTCSRASFAAGSAIFTLTVAVSPSVSNGTVLSNTATITSATADGNSANNSATATTTVNASADLAITKTDGSATEVPGTSVTYTIVASNAGPSNVTGAAVTDTLPAILTGATWTCVGAGGGTCTAMGSGNINDTVNLPAGGSVTYTVTANISASATGTLSNTAMVSSSVTDPNPGNNSATDTDTLTPQADLSITKTDGVTSAVPGQSVTYTIVASNAGPSNAPGSTVADTFPASLTATWTCVAAGGATCTAMGSGNINDTVNLPSGGSVTYTVTAAISASATGTLSNTATVATGGGVTDPTPGNNSATDTDTLTPQANLGITKTNGVTSVTAGNSVTYTIVASNVGPSDAPGSTVADTFPATITGVTWTCVGAGGGTCPANGSGNINATVNLPAGGSVTFTATGTLSSAATGTLSNTATVATGGGVTDPTPGNNSATDTDTIATSCTITCPSNQTVWTSGASSTVSYPAPTTTGVCGTVTCSPASGSTFNVGTTTVTCSANAGPTCSFTVTVNRLTFSNVSLSDPLTCTGPGNKINGSFAATNTTGASATVSVTAALTNLVALPGMATTTQPGTVTVLAGSINWTGTLGAGQTVTVNWMGQILDNQLSGAQACSLVTATVNSLPVAGSASACLTVNCPAVGPGQLPSVFSPVSDQKAGSVLIYNIYTSSTDPTKQNTRINLTNTHPSREIQVHLYFVAEGCSVADSYVCLTPNQTTSFITSDFDPGTTGYIVAVATDQLGCPVNFNYLIGDEFVKFSSGHAANLGAEAISAIAGGLTACDNNSVIATLNFDGVSYNQLPRSVAASNIPSRADGNDTMLIANRIGGNLGIGAATLGTVFGIFYDDSENAVSFTVTGSCQLRGSISNNFPRTTPRFEQLVPAGRTGWLKLFRQESDIAILGAMINFNPNSTSSIGAFNQGHNLHKLTLSSAGSYVIPVFPPPGC